MTRRTDKSPPGEVWRMHTTRGGFMDCTQFLLERNVALDQQVRAGG